MAETTKGLSSSIASTVELGSRLTFSLHTYIHSSTFRRFQISKILSEVSATAGALQQLHDILEADQNAKSPELVVLKDAGRDEIRLKVEQCEKLYRTVIRVMTKASVVGKWKGKQVKVVDTDNLKNISVVNGFSGKWFWLEPRIRRSKEQLALLKMNLLVMNEIANLARLQLSR